MRARVADPSLPPAAAANEALFCVPKKHHAPNIQKMLRVSPTVNLDERLLFDPLTS